MIMRMWVNRSRNRKSKRPTLAHHWCYIARLTVREEKRRNTFYWYAYRKIDRKLHNAYVGPSLALTAQHLVEVSANVLRKVYANPATKV